MAHPGGRPLKFQSPKELEAKIDLYFNTFPEEEWTWTGLALFLDTDRETLKSYRDKNQEGYSAPLKKALMRVENGYEKDLKKRGHSGSIFALKNFGWKDKFETDITSGGEPLASNSDMENLFKKYANTPRKTGDQEGADGEG